MKHVAIFMFPGYGHVNPTLEMSRCLIAMGHRVTYVLDEDHAAQVAAVGARMVGYRSRRGRVGQAATGEDIGALGHEFLCESMDLILPTALEAFRDDVPDLVLYDLESFFTARSAARHWDRPTVQVFPYVATNEHFSLALEVFEGASENVQKSVQLIVEHLTERGEQPDAIWRFLDNFDDRNIVLLPREFQPKGETFDERYTFVGHSFPTDEPGTGAWSGAGGGPAVLITLGTEVNEHPEFFRTCGTAFADGTRRVVMPVGRGNLPAGPPPAGHLELHEWIPFHTVMPHVEAVVCHGGISTMMMSVLFGKPLVVVPYTPEEKINGRRAEELGIGVMVPVEELTAQRLRSAVDQVAGDAEVRGRVARLRINMLAGGGPSRAALRIDDWLREPSEAGDAAPVLSGQASQRRV